MFLVFPTKGKLPDIPNEVCQYEEINQSYEKWFEFIAYLLDLLETSKSNWPSNDNEMLLDLFLLKWISL